MKCNDLSPSGCASEPSTACARRQANGMSCRLAEAVSVVMATCHKRLVHRRDRCSMSKYERRAARSAAEHHVEVACRCINLSRPRSHNDQDSPVSLTLAAVKDSTRSFAAFATLWILVGLGSAWRFRVCFGLCGHDFMSLTGVETTSSRAYESLYYTIRVDCEQQSRG